MKIFNRLLPLIFLFLPLCGLSQVTVTGGTIITGGPGGVSSINSVIGPFTFTGPGVDCTTTPGICIFSGGGGGGGVPSVNGITNAVTVAAGSNALVSTAGSTITISATSAAGSGTVAPFSQYQRAFGPNSGTSATVGPISNEYALPIGLSSAQLTAWFAGLGTGTTTTIQNGDNSHLTFTNSNFNWITDERGDVPTKEWNAKYSGAQCDLFATVGTVNLGSPTLTIAGSAFVPTDAGDPVTHAGAKSIEMVGLVSGVPTRFDANIISVTNGSTVTLSTNAPFSETNYSVDIGHNDTAAVTTAFTIGANRPIAFPAGNCWIDTTLVAGVSFHGQGINATSITGRAGDDLFASPDPSIGQPGSQTEGQNIHDMSWNVDGRIDAAKPWQDVNASGTTTSHFANYRPIGQLSPQSNNPLGPGWMLGGGPNGSGSINGVATTNSTTSITVTSTLIPAIGNDIVFPYLSSGLFSTTVTNVVGTTVTLNVAIPVTGSNQEWFAGKTVQSIVQSNASGSYANGIPATGRTYPFTLTLANDINPSPSVSSNVAPYGLVLIDGEQFAYFGSSEYPATTSTTYSITITAGAQNGTTAAAHSIGAAIAPLNPYQPTWPWPVAQASVSGSPLPANASFYPAWNIGNAAWAQPILTGAGFNGSVALTYAHVHDITINQWGANAQSAENAIGYQVQNSTAAMYIVPLPFRTTFDNITTAFTQFGIVEGTPSINNNGYFTNGFPTSDGVSWDNINIINAGYDFAFMGGGNTSYTNFTTFCENGGETGTSSPGLAPGYIGCGSAWNFTGSYDDEVTPIANYGLASGSHLIHAKNWYVEAETGPINEKQPMFVYNCGGGTPSCDYDINPQSNGTTFIIGAGNHFHGGSLAVQSPWPAINYGYGTTGDFLTNISPDFSGNEYGESAFINWGQNASVMGQANTGGTIGPYLSSPAGNQLAPPTGQTANALTVGNDATPFVNENSAIIYPGEFNTSASVDPHPMSIGWTFDDSAPISHSYTGCDVTTSGGCSTYQWDGGGRIEIGPDQRIVPGQYALHYAFKTPKAGNSFTFTLAAVADVLACTPSTLYSATITTNTTWTQNNTTANPAPILNFSGSGGCVLNASFENSSTNGELDLAYLILTPVWTNPYTNNINIVNQLLLNGSAGTTGQCPTSAGSGSPTTWGTCSGGGGSGTVTSVGFSAPSVFSISGSPVTAAGTLTLGFATGQPANEFLASPNGSAGAIGLRAIVSADVPTLNQNTTGNAATSTALASTPTICAAGQAPRGVLANGNSTDCFVPTGSGTVSSVALAMPAFITVSGSPVTTTGTLTGTLATEAANTVFGNFTGSAAAPTFTAAPTFSGANLTALNASNISSGTLPGARFGPLSGDITTSSYVATLATVNSGSGACGDATHVCAITTNAKGLTTGQSAVAITANTVSTALTTGFLPKATGSTTLGNSLIDESVTTANVATVSDTGGLAVAGTGPSIIGFGGAGVTLAGGTGVTSVTCSSTNCQTARGSLTIVGGTATTGTIATVTFPITLSGTPVCYVVQNGNGTSTTASLDLGHTQTSSVLTITAGLTVVGATVNLDYGCQL